MSDTYQNLFQSLSNASTTSYSIGQLKQNPFSEESVNYVRSIDVKKLLSLFLNTEAKITLNLPLILKIKENLSNTATVRITKYI